MGFLLICWVDYTELRESDVKIFGTWDDHDSGINNSGKSNPLKWKLRNIFLDYMDEPQDSIRRTQEGGIFISYYLDEAKTIKLILLDNRFENDEGHL